MFDPLSDIVEGHTSHGPIKGVLQDCHTALRVLQLTVQVMKHDFGDGLIVLSHTLTYEPVLRMNCGQTTSFGELIELLGRSLYSDDVVSVLRWVCRSIYRLS